MKLEPPNLHHLNAAQGWLELGNAKEAAAELDLITPALQGRPEVLEIRWQIHARNGEWEGCFEMADALVKSTPKLAWGWVHRSYALHELKRTREAFEALFPAAEKFPKDWLIQYNLACYCCCLRAYKRALSFLARAGKLGDSKQIKTMALNDADLREVWDRIPDL